MRQFFVIICINLCKPPPTVKELWKSWVAFPVTIVHMEAKNKSPVLLTERATYCYLLLWYCPITRAITSTATP